MLQGNVGVPVVSIKACARHSVHEVILIEVVRLDRNVPYISSSVGVVRVIGIKDGFTLSQHDGAVCLPYLSSLSVLGNVVKMPVVLAHIVRAVRVEQAYAKLRTVRKHGVCNHSLDLLPFCSYTY